MTTPKAKFAGLALIALILSALTGCAPPPAKGFAPSQVGVMSPNEAIIFGKFFRAVDGEIRTEEDRSFDLTPFRELGGYPAKSKYKVNVGKNSYFYSGVKRDSYSMDS